MSNFVDENGRGRTGICSFEKSGVSQHNLNNRQALIEQRYVRKCIAVHLDQKALKEALLEYEL